MIYGFLPCLLLLVIRGLVLNTIIAQIPRNIIIQYLLSYQSPNYLVLLRVQHPYNY